MNKEQALEKLSTSYSLKYLSEDLRDDKDIVLVAVEKNPFDLEYVSDRLKNDFDVVYEAAMQDCGSLRYADREILADKNAMKKILQVAGFSLEYASESIKDDIECVEISLDYRATAMRYASERLKDHKPTVIKAINKITLGMHFLKEMLSPRLREDREVALTIAKAKGYNNIFNLIILNPDWKKDKEIMYHCITNNQRDGDAMNFCSEELKNDKQFVKDCLSVCPQCFPHISEQLRDDPEVCLLAVENYEKNMRYVGENIKELIGEQDPIVVMKRYLLQEKLDNELTDSGKNNRMKL